MDILDRALAALAPDVPVLLMGPPGVGKTARVTAWARDRGYDVHVEHPVIAQSVDYRGLPAVVDGEAHWLPLGALRALCAPSDRPRLLLLDDVGQATPAVQAALMQVVLARHIGDARLADDVCIVLASNRAEDRSGARPLLAALDNRVMAVTIAADPGAWADWVVTQPDCDPMVAGYVRFRPDCFAAAVPSTPGPYCTPRSLTMAARLLARGHRHSDLISGCVGTATGADLVAWLDAAARLPEIGAVLADPAATVTKAMQADPGLMHAVTVMAARKAARDGAGVIRLADHLGGAWGVAIVSTAVGVHPEFRRDRAFRGWAARNTGLL